MVEIGYGSIDRPANGLSDAALRFAQAQEIPRTAPVEVTGQESYRYASVPTGGVEYATGIVWSARGRKTLSSGPMAGVSGVWIVPQARWICLTDNIPFKWRDLITVDSLAVHPDDPDTIYIASGADG